MPLNDVTKNYICTDNRMIVFLHVDFWKELTNVFLSRYQFERKTSCLTSTEWIERIELNTLN